MLKISKIAKRLEKCIACFWNSVVVSLVDFFSNTVQPIPKSKGIFRKILGWYLFVYDSVEV